MKKLLNVGQTSSTTDVALLVARIGIGGFMLTHGLPKMEMLFSGGDIMFPGIMGMSPELSLGLAVFAEVFCSVLLILGLATRFAVLPLLITMVVALLSIHSADEFAKQEPALHYALVYLVLLFAGSGKLSLDYLLTAKMRKSGYSTAAVKKHTLSVN